MIPYSVTVGSAAAPEASLSSLFWGAGLFVLPVNLHDCRLLALPRQDADEVRLSSPAVRSLAVAHAVGE